MVHHYGIRRSHGILIGILAGVILLALCVSGAAVAAPSTNVTISLTTTPQPPTDLEITQVGVGSINITWAKGIGANITIVRGSTVGYPYSIFDGNAIYSGNGTWVQVDSLDLTTYTYYYRAWSQNTYGTSVGYDQASVGHGTGEDGEDDTSTMGILDLSLTGDGFGLLEMLFLIAIIGFAFWKKGWIRILLSVCVITWGAFAMPYDVKVAAPLLAIGTILFFMGVLNRITEYKQSREEM